VVREIESQRLHQVTLKPKYSEKSISLAFKQAPYDLSSLYRVKVMIIFSRGSVPKDAFFFIFTPLHHRNCTIWGPKILQEYYFVLSLQAHQLSLKYEKIRLWTVMIWHGMTLLSFFKLASSSANYVLAFL
jgi:hypothetical protein